MTQPIEFDAQRNEARLGGQSMVFHCHHYNCTLQRAVETSLGERAQDVLVSAGQEATRAQLQELTHPLSTPAEKLAAADALFGELGFGRLDVSGLGARGGTVKVAASHYALGWLSKFGERDTPVCHFVSGFVGAAVCAAYGLAPERVRVKETRCQATGHSGCAFNVEIL